MCNRFQPEGRRAAGLRSGAFPGAWLGLGLLGWSVQAQQPANLSAVHRAGQTFLVWDEVLPGSTSDFYRIYRHTAEITPATRADAEMLAAVPQGSSFYPAESDRLDTNVHYVIEDLGPQLGTNQGLFVYTPRNTGDFFYAATWVSNGWENTGDFSAANSLTASVYEAAADPAPVLVRLTPSGRTRTYTQFMDYHAWNATLGGYAYNYSVALPANYTNTTAWPTHLKLVSRGSRYGDDDTSSWYNRGIQIHLDDPDNTWHYGFNESWDYRQGDGPTNGVIVNFTEQRHLRALYDVMRDPLYNVDTNRLYAWYSSMGGSGAMTLGFHYPELFAAVFCWQPVTRYRTTEHWRKQDFEPLWGAASNNLPIVNRGRFAGPITNFNGLGVFDWMDHFAILTNQPGRHVPMFFFHAGKNDDNIEYDTQGAPAPALFQEARAGFVAMIDPSSHSGIAWVDWPTAATTNWDIRNLNFRLDSSFPAFSWASGNDAAPPPASPLTNFYNKTLEWSCAWNDFAGDIVDTPTQYVIVVRSGAGTQHAAVTIRRPQAFRPAPGTGIIWSNIPLGAVEALAFGDLRVDAHGLVTLPHTVITPTGNRLVFRTDPLTDSLNDGVPDYWLDAHDLDPLDPADGASADSDEDGFTNEQEYRARTNPRDAGSRLEIEELAPDRIAWQSSPGQSYRLEHTTNYVDWLPYATSVVAVGSVTEFVAPSEWPEPAGAFRLRLD
ncbi:MAG: hypothetical protein K9N49_04275 [Candidatus Marinimicrobia bacterium]|nr:hypothetical protein [Candidatus Neomarinimicrobiota bacterium]